MNQHKAYQIILEDGNKIVFIPTLNKLFLVRAEQFVPEFIQDEQQSKKAASLPDYNFRAVHLIVNNMCNLKCTYCYANAGERRPEFMSSEIAKAAVNKVVDDTKNCNFPVFEVGLIGGEPSLSIGLIREVVPFTRDLSSNKGLQARIGMVSNGLFNKDIRDFITTNLDYITISLDGFKRIHDSQRPTVGNEGSYDVVYENAKMIYDSGTTLGIRCTVSSSSVELLPEIIEFLHESFPKAMIGVEPLQECGRCLTSGALGPDPMIYANKLLEALKIVKSRNICIKSSVLRFKCQDDHISFCGVNGQNFAVNPRGFVTGCTRVTSLDDPMADFFYYGKYDRENKCFTFDEEKYKNLKKLEVDNIPECANCFAKFNCKGDCPIIKSDYCQDFAYAPSQRCEAIKKITLGLFKLQLGL